MKQFGKPYFPGERQYRSCECPGPANCGDTSCRLVREFNQTQNRRLFTPIPSENEIKCDICGKVRNRNLNLCPDCG